MKATTEGTFSAAVAGTSIPFVPFGVDGPLYVIDVALDPAATDAVAFGVGAAGGQVLFPSPGANSLRLGPYRAEQLDGTVGTVNGFSLGAGSVTVYYTVQALIDEGV